MPRFGILWLFALTLIVAMLVTLANWNALTAFHVACLTLSCFFAVASRFAARTSNGIAVAVAVLTSIVVGSLMAAYGSYYHTFIKPSSGFLVGGGWESVFGAAIFGGLFGAIGSPFSVVLYLIVTAIIWARNKTSSTSSGNITI